MSDLIATQAPLSGVFVLQPKVYGDARGFFYESFNQAKFNAACGFTAGDAPCFVQDNHSRSGKGILRGLHYQIEQAQGKLVRVAKGAAYDVVVDLRRSSVTFGHWFGVELNEEKCNQLYVPKGFAHGFLALTEQVDFLYKTTDYYAPQHECSLLWNDPAIGIDWPLLAVGEPKLNAKDIAGKPLNEAALFA
jgi:dTDP-4-dehydrorhamnose 3,5-epimerase